MDREVRLFDELDAFAQRGPITHALALTYGYDGDIANERIWRPLVEKYGVKHPLVIADGQVASGNMLGVHVVRPQRRGNGVFHPKLFLAVREDAVLLATGSANLTAGGLGGNLELMTILTYARDVQSSANLTVLRDALAFLETIVRGRLQGHINSSSLAVFDGILKHAALASAQAKDTAGAPRLAFVHSGGTPIWDQVRKIHGDDPVDHLLIVSPFYQREDPTEPTDAAFLANVLNDPEFWSDDARAPRIRLHIGEDSVVAGIPRETLLAYPDDMHLHLQLCSAEPRRLHGKLVVLAGRTRTTVLWGSPNFTPAALRRRCDASEAAHAGNVECGLVLSAPAGELPIEVFERNFGLQTTFKRATELPEAPPAADIEPRFFDVGELLYDHSLGELTFTGEILSSQVASLTITPTDGGAPLFRIAVGVGVIAHTWDGRKLEEIEPSTGMPRLRDLYANIVALDLNGGELGRERIRVNVLFDDAIEVHKNLLLGATVLSADALLIPSTAPPEQRFAQVDGALKKITDSRQAGASKTSRHQASLDTFQRNVRRGLDAHLRALTARKWARFTLSGWSSAMRRALAATTPEVQDLPRRAFLVLRVSEHVVRVLDGVASNGDGADSLRNTIESPVLADALRSVVLESETDPIFRSADAARHRAIQQLEALS